MSLSIGADNYLQTSQNDIQGKQPFVLRLFAQLVSIIFHPLFINGYVAYYLVFMQPGFFDGMNERAKAFIVIQVVINMIFFPAVAVFLLKATGFIKSVFLKTQKERIIPYITSSIFFFWMYLVFRNQSYIPIRLTAFVFSVFISASAALIANIYFKISMHAIGVGGLLGLFILIIFKDSSFGITLPFMSVIFICGLVLTARLFVSDHSVKDVYYGFFLGWIVQLFCSILIR
jgi:hypothetical protein